VRAARHRQEQHEADWRHQRRGAEPQPRGACRVRAHVHSEHQPHRGERAERVPVRERLVESRAGAQPAGGLDHARQETRGQRIAANDRYAAKERRLDHAVQLASAQDGGSEQEGRDVERAALDIGQPGVAQGRPEERQRRPAHERSQRCKGDAPSMGRRQRARLEHEDDRYEHPGGRARQHAQLTVDHAEVPAREKGEHRWRRE